MNPFLYKEYRHLKRFNLHDFMTMSAVAMLGGAIGTLAIVRALFLTNFAHLSIIILLQKLQPIFAIIFARILLKEKMSKIFFKWAAVAIIASYFLTFGLHFPTWNNNLEAIICSLIAAFSFGSSTVFSKKILQKYSFYAVNFYRFGLTALFMFVYVLLSGDIFTISKVTPESWGIFILIAVTTGSGALFIYYYGLKKVRASTATICELFFPLSAIIFDYIFNNQTLSIVQWSATIIIIYSIFKISTAKKK